MNHTPHIQIPTADLHARFFASGLTKNSLESIVQAHAELYAALEEYHTLHGELCSLHDYEYTPFYEIWMEDGTWQPSVEQQQELADYNLLNSETPDFDNWTSRERWPVKSWEKAARGYRKLNKKFAARLNGVATVQQQVFV